jgi:hypothetical protein
LLKREGGVERLRKFIQDTRMGTFRWLEEGGGAEGSEID